MNIYIISVLFLLCFRARLFIDALWSSAGKGWPLCSRLLSLIMKLSHFFIGILGQVWCLIVSIPDLYPLSSFVPTKCKIGYFDQLVEL